MPKIKEVQNSFDIHGTNYATYTFGDQEKFTFEQTPSKTLVFYVENNIPKLEIFNPTKNYPKGASFYENIGFVKPHQEIPVFFDMNDYNHQLNVRRLRTEKIELIASDLVSRLNLDTSKKLSTATSNGEWYIHGREVKRPSGVRNSISTSLAKLITSQHI